MLCFKSTPNRNPIHVGGNSICSLLACTLQRTTKRTQE